ncbi:MAG TPA: signal peptidase I [Candidatus Nanopelagicaceae bacterium]
MRLPKKGSLLREVPIIIVSALVVSILIKTFLVHFFYVPSGSMENTLRVGDRIAVNKLAAMFSDIKRGEVVVFKDPDNWLGTAPAPTGNVITRDFKRALVDVGVVPDPSTQYLVKRAIGVGGDHVVCCDVKGHLKINGISIDENYLFPGNTPSDSKFDVTVPNGFIWVMGDHRAASADSRFHTDDIHKGFVPLSDVVGRAEFIVWPFNHMTLLSVGPDLSKVPVNKKP